MLSPWSYVSLVLGAALTMVGATACVRWYIFWKRNYRGELLTTGPYARVRHPFYTGFLSLAVGLAVLIPLLETVMLAVFSVGGILFFVQREEEFLLQRYGRAYVDYRRRVPYKIIPGVY